MTTDRPAPFKATTAQANRGFLRLARNYQGRRLGAVVGGLIPLKPSAYVGRDTVAADGPNEVQALVLSGGGAKGSFQAGALQGLNDCMTGWDPGIVSGASIGAINALPVAERATRGIEALEQVWFSLRNSDDMYQPSAALKKLMGLLPDDGEFGYAIKNIAGVPTLTDDSPQPTNWLEQVGGVVEDAVALAETAWNAAFNDLEGEVVGTINAALRTIFDEMTGLYSIRPVGEKIRTAVNFENVSNSGIELRLYAVEASTGSLIEFNEEGSLRTVDRQGRAGDWRQLARDANGWEEAPRGEALTMAALASAAMPVFFERQALTTSDFKSRSERWSLTDGGLRESTPLRGVLDLGAKDVIVITTSALDSEGSQGPPRGILNSALRYVGIAANEIATNDLLNVGREIGIEWRDGLEGLDLGDASVRVIHPTVNVHAFAQIQPALIAINYAYGWMRASELAWFERNSLENLSTTEAVRKIIALGATDMIAIRRMGVFRDHQFLAWRHNRRRLGVVEPPEAEALTDAALWRMRHRLTANLEAMERRLVAFGAAAIPPAFGAESWLGPHKTSYWWTSPERVFFDPGGLRDEYEEILWEGVERPEASAALKAALQE